MKNSGTNDAHPKDAGTKDARLLRQQQPYALSTHMILL